MIFIIQRKALIVAWLLATLVPAQAQENWVEWKTSEGGNGHWYALTTPKTWADAEKRAVNLGGHLASIADKAEDDFVRWTVAGGTNAWVGLRDGLSSWTWTDGTEVQYWAAPTSEKTTFPLFINGSSDAVHWRYDTSTTSTSRRAILELSASPDSVRPKVVTPAVTWYQWPTNYGGNGHWYGICEAGQTNEGALNLVEALGVNLVSFADTNEATFASRIVGINVSSSFFRTGLSAPPGEPFRWPDGAIVGDEVPEAKGRTNTVSSLVRYCFNAFGLVPMSDQGNHLGSLLESTTHPTNLPPAFTQYPQSQECLQGAILQLSAFAVGAEPMHYQWKIGGIPLLNETNRQFELIVSTSTTGAVSVVVSNFNGVVESEPATIGILPVVKAGSFDWIQRPAALGGNDHWYASLPLTSGLTWSNAYELANRLGGYLPTFTSNQEAVRFANPWPLGAVGNFWLGLTDVDTEGEFRWIDGSLLTESSWNNGGPTGQPNASTPDHDYVFASTGDLQNPFRWGVDTNDTRQNWIIIERDSDPRNMPSAVVELSPAIRMRVGASNQLQVAAAGTGVLAYQWIRNGELIANATNAVLQIENAMVDHSGLYTVVVSNVFGAVTSAPVSVTAFVPQAPELSLTIGHRSENGLLRLDLQHDFPDDTSTIILEVSTNLVDWVHWMSHFHYDPRNSEIWIDPPNDTPSFFYRARREPE